MKRALILSLLFATALAARATVTINVGASILSDQNGTPLPEGTLVQLVASTQDNIFNNPNDGDFTGNTNPMRTGLADDLVIASFTINSGAGSVAQAIQITLSGNLNAGDLLMLRWYPSIMSATPPAGSPQAGSRFGQFRTDMVENFSNSAWVMPADGNTIDLNFLTQSAGGTRTDAEGRANFTVDPIPEPSTYALLAMGVIALVAVRRRLKLA